MGYSLVLTDKGQFWYERFDKARPMQKKLKSNYKNSWKLITGEVGYRQPIDLDSFYLEMKNLGYSTRKVDSALGWALEQGYIK